MALSNKALARLISALTSRSAGLEFASAIDNGLVLSADTYRRLGIAMTDVNVASHIQSAIQGQSVLSERDRFFMVCGFADEDTANEVAGIADIAQVINPPVNVSMPPGFSISVTRDPVTFQQIAELTFPAGSTFPSSGPGAYFLISNAGNANLYYVWYNVLGGSNTDPAVPGRTGIQVNILPGDSDVAVANKTYAAIASALVAMASSVLGNVVTVTSPAILVATPTFAPIAGSYVGSQLVAISTVTPGATIYYTINGSTPTTSSTLYVAPFNVGATQTVKALAVKSGMGNSLIGSALYTISAAPGVATHLTWTVQPSSAAAGAVFATQPVIQIRDASNNPVTSGPDATALITLTLLTGTGALAGTVSMNAVAGVANFVGKGLNVTVYGDKVLRATKADTTGGGGTGPFTADSNLLNISNNLATVNLNSAINYTILSKAGISDAGASFVVGDIAVSPIASTAITGFALVLDGGGQFATSAKVSGQVFAANYAAPTPATLTSAVSDMQTAYTDAAGRTLPDFTNLGAGNIGGLTLTPGLYKWTTGVTIPNNVTFSGGPNDIWILQISGTLGMSSAKSIILAGGAKAENIFWQVTGAVTVQTSAVFKGIILTAVNIAFQTNASLDGRMYAQTAVTLDSNAVTEQP